MSTPPPQGAPPGPPPPPPPRIARKANASKGAEADKESATKRQRQEEPPPAPKPAPPRRPLTGNELLKQRQKDHNAFMQQLEIDRILTVAFRMNPYEVLDVPTHADEKTINRVFRRKSLLIHPDKVHDDTERANLAFGMLQQATTDLLEEDRRRNIDSVVRSAERLALHELNLANVIDQDRIVEEEATGRLANLIPSWQERVRECVKHFLVDDEVRKRRAMRMRQEAEIDSRLRREEAEEELRRRSEPDTRWEDTRESRVKGWRSFQKAAGKKRKKGPTVLG